MTAKKKTSFPQPVKTVAKEKPVVKTGEKFVKPPPPKVAEKVPEKVTEKAVVKTPEKVAAVKKEPEKVSAKKIIKAATHNFNNNRNVRISHR